MTPDSIRLDSIHCKVYTTRSLASSAALVGNISFIHFATLLNDSEEVGVRFKLQHRSGTAFFFFFFFVVVVAVVVAVCWPVSDEA